MVPNEGGFPVSSFQGVMSEGVCPGSTKVQKYLAEEFRRSLEVMAPSKGSGSAPFEKGHKRRVEGILPTEAVDLPEGDWQNPDVTVGLRPQHPSVARDANNLATILREKGELGQALKYASRALNIGRSVFDPENPSVAILQNNLGQILYDLEELDLAQRHTARAMEVLKRALDENHPSTRAVAANLEIIQQRLQRSLRGDE